MNKKEEIVKLYYEDNLTQKEIAEKSGITQGYVSQVIKEDERYFTHKEEKHKTYLVYRLELCAFTNVPYESKLTAQHIDGNRLNNNLSNLMWLTRGDNIRQGFVDGLYTSQIKTCVIDKLSNEKFEFRNMTIASEFIGKSKGYISKKIRKGSYCNNEYE